MAKSIIYFVTSNENASNIYGIDPLFVMWARILVGESVNKVIECVKELENLWSNFETKYPGLSNLREFESRLLT